MSERGRNRPFSWKLWLVWLCSPVASADLLPPYQDQVEARVRNDPAYYDHADAFCRGKVLGDSCVITGTALEGGGEGMCRQRLDGGTNQVIAECVRFTTPMIDRRLPVTPYQLEPIVCGMLKASPGQKFRDSERQELLGCGPVETVSDRFCTGRKQGEACTAQLTIGGKSIENPGVCLLQKDWRNRSELRIDVGNDAGSVDAVFRYANLSRPALLCEAAKPVVQQIRPARPPSMLRRWLERLW